MTRDRKEEGLQGILRTLGNFDTYAERFEFFRTCALLKEYGQIYYQTLDYGVISWKNVLKNNIPAYSVENSTKGFRGLEASDMSLTEEEFYETYQCEFYNFNLIKGRDTLFPESTAFFDNGHMSVAGADSFTHVFCDVITADDPESYFWKSYDEAEQHGSYSEWIAEARLGEDK